ncbi:hypothetical protein SAMN05892883_2218 [Jatrophihabitans sp. GAS493]|uniref:hypothetical protein n=1 Tax=Jatrophihabitans sp. GAS493 TaxID=1907575 RepID=UPI000BB94596|nr:hypothetical protein [Jatrophihabitans sp. GAS493]SOD72902.1 hypothetical protein SAMN05892883_2218 [Jatrophihabitans sp. GAS493]
MRSYYGPRGPYGTESEVIAATGQRDWPITDSHAEHNAARLQEAVTAAGVEVGSYDQRILSWLAGYEPQTVEVIAALIARAGQRGIGSA